MSPAWPSVNDGPEGESSASNQTKSTKSMTRQKVKVTRTLLGVLIFICSFERLAGREYSMGCECGLREIDEEKEKECKESAMLESVDNV